MNAVEIEEAVSLLFESPFQPESFSLDFLGAYGNNDTTLKRLKSGGTNSSDIGGVLQRNNIHIAVSEPGLTTQCIDRLRSSPATAKGRVKFILTTDGEQLLAENLADGDVLSCTYAEFPDHFAFFFALAGITTVQQVRDNAFDVKATARLNRLYVQLLSDNPTWVSRREEMNHFMARLIFCFFAEDTSIFTDDDLFVRTVETMSYRDPSITHEVIGTLFAAMNTRPEKREVSGTPRWASRFPYVNGGLFSGHVDVPVFSKTARNYFMSIGRLDWTKINPDIFGSMIQAVADDEERSALGMHYTSVPNILKVLDPLFLDELREQLEAAGDNSRKLLNLRKRIAHMRVFDPACGSGNFLVVAYKKLREIENDINIRRDEKGRKSEIPLTNFRGIEIRHFSSEVARLALIIAEYQCNVLYLGQTEALEVFLPLEQQNWISCNNALQVDWLSVCPPAGTTVKTKADDLFQTPLDQREIGFENVGGETFICGNPPYRGSKWQTVEQKDDLKRAIERHNNNFKQLDLVAGWFIKAAEYSAHTPTSSAFVTTNSLCQGEHVAGLWPTLVGMGMQISFAHTSFKWANLASHNAGVTVAIVGISNRSSSKRRIFSTDEDGAMVVREVASINPYLFSGPNTIVVKSARPTNGLHEMKFGCMPRDGGHLLMSADELGQMGLTEAQRSRFVRPFLGSAEFIRGVPRYCLWIDDIHLQQAMKIPAIKQRIDAVKTERGQSRDPGGRELAKRPHQMREFNEATTHTIIVPGVSSESRSYLPVGLLPKGVVVSNLAFALYDAPLWNLSLIASRLHLTWIGAVCGKMKTDYRYSNTLGWNTFPVPKLTEKNQADLIQSANDILLAREAHFPATIAALYAADAMPTNLREAHERNDEVVERIFIGRRFKNDTERLEKLFTLYAEMTSKSGKKAA